MNTLFLKASRKVQRDRLKRKKLSPDKFCVILTHHLKKMSMQIIEDLQHTKSLTLSYFEMPEAQLQKAYGPGKWTIRQLLHHITDADSVLYDRIRRAIAGPKPVVWAFDQDRWASSLDYNTFPLAINKAIYTSVRDGIIYLASQHYEGGTEKLFIHSETGLRSLKHEFDKVVWHNQRHLDQIAKALENG